MIKSQIKKRGMAALLALAMAVSLCCAFAGTVEAKTSLPAVEEIKTTATQADPFTILEIVPETDQGSIGYYIDGEEPWVILAGEVATPAARKTFVEGELHTYLNKSNTDTENAENNYSIQLVSTASGTNTSYPLNYVGNYSEVYPWVWSTAPDTTYADYTKQMPLATAESGTAKGAMAYVGMGYGDYIIGDYEYLEDGPCVQLIKGFKTEPVDSEKGYWYNVSFQELTYDLVNDIANGEAAKWAVIYEEGTVDDKDLEVGGNYYKYVGIVGDRDFPGLDVNKTYYKAVLGQSGQPYTSQTAAQEKVAAGEYSLFADISGSFRDKETGETGYFSKISYEYVGDGNGTYAFTPSETGTSYNVKTKIVYYKGGYTNNNWFLKNVFDFDDSEIANSGVTKPTLSVNTVAASNVTPAQYNAADMIVLNYGFDISATTFSGIYKNDFSSSDLPTSLVATIATSTKPIIFDYNLTGLTPAQGTCVQDAAEALLSAALANRTAKGQAFSTTTGHTFVGGNIYTIDSIGWSTGSGEDMQTHSALPLATVNFNLAGAIDGDHLLKSDAFYPVFEEIFYENFLREIRNDAEEKLDTNVTMATSIRYIINYANTRQINDKTTVRVLDIEPRTGSLSSTQTNSLATWLGISSSNLIVTTMSTAEFVGLKADISEDYDLVYIGDSTIGFNTSPASFYVSGGFLGLFGTTYAFNYITYNDYTMSYRESSSESSINKDAIIQYVNNRQNASWFFNMQASDIVFGMRYTSIGDKVTSGSTYKLSGLLDRDYTEDFYLRKQTSLYWPVMSDYMNYYYGTVLNATGSTNTFRYSGNDLTEAASQKIEKFASSGYPVILADSLLQPPEFDDSTKTVARAHYKPLLINYSYAATPTLTIADSILKVTLKSSDSLFYTIYSANCQLYKNGVPATDSDGNTVIKTISPFRSASFNLSDYGYNNGDKFYCTVTITRVRYPLLPIFLGTAVSDQVGKTATVTIRGNAEPLFVDNSSVMYETINNIVGRANVMNWSSLNSTVTDLKQTLLKRFVNLSKPTIAFWNKTDADYYPTTYAMDTSGNMNCLADDDSDGIYELNYVFKITNDSDPFPTRTSYGCNLYLDLNGNGLFEEDESVTDFALRDWTVYSPTFGSAGLRVQNGELQGSYGTEEDNQHYYYVSYEMPSDMVGIIPWKLVVTDKTYFGGHDSVTDYTRVVPAEEPETIKILQINATGSGNTNNLQYDIANINGTYNKLFQKVASDFKVSLTTIPANFDSLWTTSPTTYGTSTTGSTESTTVNTLFTKTGEAYTRQTGTGAVESFSTLTALLESYDMLIIGFGDAYKDLDLTVTKAVADYINADKPVLMTHDTLSFLSQADGSFVTSNSDATLSATNTGSFFNPNWVYSWTPNPSYFYGSAITSYGYYPNMLLRDLIGMDRYGVTSLKTLSTGQSIGVNKYAGIGRTTDITSSASANQLVNSSLRNYIKSLPGFSSWNGGYVPSTTYYSGGAALDSTRQGVMNEIANKGYSVAWKADKSRTQTVSETQGLTNAVLFRFMDTSISAWLSGKTVDSYTISYTNNDSARVGLSTKVSQVNKGQITTYPFNINTAAFTGETYNPAGANSMTVQLTHAQNYQLNTNSDDMMVWYCLAPDSTYGSGIYQKNDVVNAYYIYTCGNVTYTGSGHTAIPATYSESNTAANNEAKLFINTMLAAYRVALNNSSVSFSNQDGSIKGITDFFVVTDDDTVLHPDSSKYSDSARYIYFTVNDTNVDSAKIMEASFKYGDYDLFVPIYDADTDEAVCVPIYDADTNKMVYTFVEPYRTLISTYTYYVKLDDIISILLGTEKTELTAKEELPTANLDKLTVTLRTTYGSGASLTKTAEITMRQYRLFDLS